MRGDDDATLSLGITSAIMIGGLTISRIFQNGYSVATQGMSI